MAASRFVDPLVPARGTLRHKNRPNLRATDVRASSNGYAAATRLVGRSCSRAASALNSSIRPSGIRRTVRACQRITD